MMLGIKPYKQITNYSCGPAALQMVLSHLGIKKSQRALIKLCNARKGYGCDPDDIVRAAKELDLRARYKRNSSIKELKRLVKKGFPVIVDWFSPSLCGHYSVVIGFKGKKIVLADPEKGELREMKLDDFVNRWFELDDYPPKNPASFALREIVVIQK